MAEDEEYELVPHKIVSELKREVEELKQNPLGSTSSGNDLQSSMNALAHGINDLLTLFKDATDQMRMEEKDSQVLSKRMEPMIEKLDVLIDQNHKIAKGILAVADMLKDHLRNKRHDSAPAMPGMPERMPQQMRPSYRPPFPEFAPMPDSGMSRQDFGPAPYGASSFNAPPSFGVAGGPVPPVAPRSIPPAPAPPKSLNA